MIRKPHAHASLPVGVVVRRTPGVTRWARWHWSVAAVLPGAGPAEWRELRREGEAVEYHAATLALELHGAETESYLHALAADPPVVFVVLREAEAGPAPMEVVLVTASPYEAEAYTDSGEEIVEKVPMPPALSAWIAEFVQQHHRETPFVKRQRDRKRVDLVEDGIGDPRIEKPGDVYASPALKRRRLQ